ncbi:hypothetical protein CEB3_c21080 [Peptococcaceae bacterium CEB3]|nr:hypothetical protein CEB3_c21080 [Peptococcaceae bacterium CEB3]
MRDVFMFCNESEDCICENVCCQECDQRTSCANRCQAVRYKQKVYSSEGTLLRELDALAERTDNWRGCAQIEEVVQRKTMYSRE